MHYIIIGASRGLGAALVEECLKKEGAFVIGIARTPKQEIENYSKLITQKNFQYYKLDIGSAESIRTLSEIQNQFPQEPVTIIYNAAVIESDISKEGTFIHSRYNETCVAGVVGLGNVIEAFGKHLIRFGGCFVGISSFGSLAPAFREQKLAYPASKAFMNMALRSLRILWPKKVRIMTVLLGHIGDKQFKTMPKCIVPSYATVAQAIMRTISGGRRIPRVIRIPWWYALLYAFLNLFPDEVPWSMYNFIRGKTKR